MTTVERYFIKDDFVENPVLSFDREEQESYWSAPNLSATPYYQRPVYDFALNLMRQTAAKKVIDVGCGSAHKLARIQQKYPTAEYIGIDQESAINYCQRSYTFGQWIAANLDEPLPENIEVNGDLVLCVDVIEHLAQPEVLLQGLKSLVSATGQIIISTPDRERYRGPLANSSPNIYHVREWSEDEFTKLLHHFGYEMIQFFHVLPVNMTWNRLTYHLIVKRFLKRQPIRTGQVAVVRPMQ